MLKVLHIEETSEGFKFDMIAPVYIWNKFALEYCCIVTTIPVGEYLIQREARDIDFCFDAWEDMRLPNTIIQCLQQLYMEFDTTNNPKYRRMLEQIVPMGFMQIGVVNMRKSDILALHKREKDNKCREVKDLLAETETLYNKIKEEKYGTKS